MNRPRDSFCSDHALIAMLVGLRAKAMVTVVLRCCWRFCHPLFFDSLKKTGGLSLPFNRLSDLWSDLLSDLYGLQFNKLAEAVGAQFTAVARLFVATKWCGHVEGTTIDRHLTGADLSGCRDGTFLGAAHDRA